MKFLVVLSVFAALAVLANCGSTQSTLGEIGSPSSGSGSSATPTPTPGASATPPGANANSTLPFEVIVQSQYEGGGPFTSEIDCQVPVGSGFGTTLNCNPSIPEGRLYFSSLSFIMNIGNGATANPFGCSLVVFKPYYYLASNAAAFQPSWESAASIACNVSPIPIGCYSGIGTLLIPSFPQYSGIVYDVSTSTTFTATATSAHTNSRASDRWTVNDLSTDGVGEAGPVTFLGGTDGYVNNSMQDYSFTCNDAFMQPIYTFNMHITKINVVGGGANIPGDTTTNQFPDWSIGSWDQ